MTNLFNQYLLVTIATGNWYIFSGCSAWCVKFDNVQYWSSHSQCGWLSQFLSLSMIQFPDILPPLEEIELSCVLTLKPSHTLQIPSHHWFAIYFFWTKEVIDHLFYQSNGQRRIYFVFPCLILFPLFPFPDLNLDFVVSMSGLVKDDTLRLLLDPHELWDQLSFLWAFKLSDVLDLKVSN